MTLPAHQGTITMGDVNVELQLASTSTISLNDTKVRDLFEIPSGMISLDDGHGKSYNQMYAFNTGDESYDGDYKILTIDYTSTITIVGSVAFEYLMVAGGGGGGAHSEGGGGGGAGGILTGTGIALQGSVTIYIGQGGAVNTNGGNTYWNDPNFSPGFLTTTGGGAGGARAPSSGGSGGGGCGNNGGAAGIAGQGNSGGSSWWSNWSNTGAGGGGGGKGGVGGSFRNQIGAGHGGVGISSWITGTEILIGGGGGGCGDGMEHGNATHGGGSQLTSIHGIQGTGGGGAGGRGSNTTGLGGSGIVILRYKYK